MKMKASVDYGIRTMLYLAAKGSTCSSREISEEMQVPRDYLIQLALRLRNAGLIKARPGKNGGYVLAKAPSKITVLQIMDAFDSELKHSRSPLRGRRNANPRVETVLRMHTLISDSLNAYLGCITVQDLLDACEDGKPGKDFIAVSLKREGERLLNK